jgi:hypothetical protein
MSASITVKFTMSRKEIASSLRQSLVRQKVVLVVVALLLAMAALPLVAAVRHAENPQVPFQPASFLQTAVGVLGVAYLFGVLPVVLARRTNPALVDHEQVLSFSDEGMDAVTGAGSAKIPWKSWVGYRETEGFFLLQFGPRAFQALPKRVFATPQELIDFRNLLKQKLRR